VASAGNDSSRTRKYPAAHSNVLGVTGLHCLGEGQYSAFSGSNYYSAQLYPISGIYNFAEGVYAGMSTSTIWYQDNIFHYYDYFGGTSAAAPQVTSLAYHLYSFDNDASYQDVWHHIVETRDNSTDQSGTRPVAGILDFDHAIQTW
jgi:hypothetical protein